MKRRSKRRNRTQDQRLGQNFSVALAHLGTPTGRVTLRNDDFWRDAVRDAHLITRPGYAGSNLRTAIETLKAGLPVMLVSAELPSDYAALDSDSTFALNAAYGGAAGGGTKSLRALKGRDVHRDTAAEMFGVAPEDATPEMRARAKTANFKLVYSGKTRL